MQIRTSQTKGSYGFSCPCPTSGPSENEGSSFQPITRSLPLCHSDALVHSSAAALEKCSFTLMGPTGGHHVAESGNDRRVLNRMGNHPGKQNIELCVAEHSLLPHKLFGVHHSLEGSEKCSALPARTSCAGGL